MATGKNFFMEIVTPEGKVFSGDAEFAVVPALEGEVGILPGHAALLSEINIGELRVTQTGSVSTFVVESGIVEIRDNRVSVAVESCQRQDLIDREAVLLMKADAENRIKENRDPGLVERARNDLRLALLLEKVSAKKMSANGNS